MQQRAEAITGTARPPPCIPLPCLARAFRIWSGREKGTRSTEGGRVTCQDPDYPAALGFACTIRGHARRHDRTTPINLMHVALHAHAPPPMIRSRPCREAPIRRAGRPRCAASYPEPRTREQSRSIPWRHVFPRSSLPARPRPGYKCRRAGTPYTQSTSDSSR